MSLTYSDRYHQDQLRARINDERKDRVAHLAEGNASDYADYLARVSYLTALRDVLAWSDDIAKTINRDTRKSA